MTAAIHAFVPRRPTVHERIDRPDDRVDRLDTKVDRLETKVDRLEVMVDGRFAQVDERFARIDERFDKIELQLKDLRTHFDVIAESWDGKFALLYDVVKAHAEKTDRRFEEMTALIQSNHMELRAMIKLTYESLDRRVTVLERRLGPPKRRR